MATAELVPVTEIQKNVLTTKEYAESIAVESAEQYTEACDFVKSIAKTRKEVEETFGPIKKKQHEAWKEAVAQENKFLIPLDAATLTVRSKISKYLAAEEAKRKEQEAQERERARVQAEEQALAEASELERQGNTAEAEQVIEQAAVAPPPVVIVPKTVPKQEGITTRVIWKFRVTDSAKVPREYMSVDESKIGQVVRAMKGSANIPGVEVYSEDSVVVR